MKKLSDRILITYIQGEIRKAEQEVRNKSVEEVYNFYHTYIKPFHDCYIKCKEWVKLNGYSDEKYENLWCEAQIKGCYIDSHWNHNV